VLLIMGLGYTSEMWHRVAPPLAERFRVIRFDNRGVGRSECPAVKWSMADMAADCAAVLDAASVDRAHVFGISMGGMIAQELTLRHASHVKSLILGCTSCGGSEAAPADDQVLRVLNARAHMTPEEGVWAMVPYIYDDSTPQSRIEQDLQIRLRTFPTARAYLTQLAAIQSWGSYSRLAGIRVPTLVIHGENDKLVPPENGRILARAIPQSELLMLQSASHIFTTDQPEGSLSAVRSFFERSSDDRSGPRV